MANIENYIKNAIWVSAIIAMFFFYREGSLSMFIAVCLFVVNSILPFSRHWKSVVIAQAGRYAHRRQRAAHVLFYTFNYAVIIYFCLRQAYLLTNMS